MALATVERVVVETGRFETWHADIEPRLRHALVASYGVDRGREATAEALAWAWEHAGRALSLEHPVAFLYRVGQSRTRTRRARHLRERAEWCEPWVEAGLAALSERQRVTVVLVHGHGWTHAEVAELLGVTTSSVQTHLERGLRRLRSHLEVADDG